MDVEGAFFFETLMRYELHSGVLRAFELLRFVIPAAAGVSIFNELCGRGVFGKVIRDVEKSSRGFEKRDFGFF